MSYETLKKELIAIIDDHYQNGAPINDIRAAFHAAYLIAEQYGAIELMEIAKSMAKNPDA